LNNFLDIKGGIMIKADFMRQPFSTYWRVLSSNVGCIVLQRERSANRIPGKIRIVSKHGGQVGIAYVLSALAEGDLVARTLWLLHESVERINETWCTACLRDQKKMIDEFFQAATIMCRRVPGQSETRDGIRLMLVAR
jgi:hypothetical protein